jgi:hypothetical protein
MIPHTTIADAGTTGLGFRPNTLLIVASLAQCKCPGLGSPGHVLIGTMRQSESDQAARLTRWSDFSA